MSLAIQLTLALLLDALFGEPKWLWSRAPHPAVLMGRLITRLDNTLNAAPYTRLKGVAALILIIFVVGSIGWALSLLGGIVTTICAAILLAHRSLVQHVQAVADGLRQSTASGRQAVALIVSRDTSQATPASVARSSLESLAENFSDAVVAPAFWFLVAGLPGLLIYKMVNTADSMIGYLTPRHAAFGWAAARCDDLLNWVPARLSALMLAIVGGCINTWGAVAQDAQLHRSPNAGWPEAALARSLNIALAGPRSYDGKMTEFAWVNASGRRDLAPSDIDAGVALVWKTWAVMVATLFVLGGILWVI